MLFSGWSDLYIIGNMRDASLKPMGEGRPAGLHLGTIINRMRRDAGLPSGPIDGDQDGVRLQEGFLWEMIFKYISAGVPVWEAIDLAFKLYCFNFRQGVLSQVRLLKDGVHMTPDDVDTKVPCIDSMKATRKSPGRDLASKDEFTNRFWPWITQEASYLWALQDMFPGICKARYFAWFMAGDYSKGPGSGPKMLTCTVVFGLDELADNWRNVMLKKKEYGL